MERVRQKSGGRANLPTISIIDDEAAVCRAVGSLVRSFGFAVRTYGSATEFLSSPDALNTSCIISDIQMPGMSGIALQQHLLREGHTLPFIFITALPDSTLAQQAGPNACLLRKPFDAQALAACMMRVLEDAGTPAHLSALESTGARRHAQESDMTGSDESVTENPAARRFEMRVSGHLAIVEYREVDGVLDLVHTEVPDALSGRGVGSRLAQGVFDQLRASGRKAKLSCSFLQAWAPRHPEVADLVIS